MIRRISNKVGGLRNLLFIGALLALTLVLLLDIFVVHQILSPWNTSTCSLPSWPSFTGCTLYTSAGG